MRSGDSPKILTSSLYKIVTMKTWLKNSVLWIAKHSLITTSFIEWLQPYISCNTNMMKGKISYTRHLGT